MESGGMPDAEIVYCSVLKMKKESPVENFRGKFFRLKPPFLVKKDENFPKFSPSRAKKVPHTGSPQKFLSSDGLNCRRFREVWK